MSSTSSQSGLPTTSETSSVHIEAAGHEWFPGIEVLRGFAATAVVIEHCWDLAQTGPPDTSFLAYILLGLGEWGVDLFFLLSGFLLAEFFWAGTGKRSTLEFYVRRFFRIAPAYYFCVAILFLFFAEHSLLFSMVGLKQIGANTTFTQWLWPNTSSNLNVNGSLWTLTIEMMLYAFMPLFAWLIAKRPVVACLSLAGLGAPLSALRCPGRNRVSELAIRIEPRRQLVPGAPVPLTAILGIHSDLRVGHGTPMGDHAGIPAAIRETINAGSQHGGGVRPAVAQFDHPQGVRTRLHLSTLDLVHVLRLRHLPADGSRAPVRRPTVHRPAEDCACEEASGWASAATGCTCGTSP